VSIKLMKLVEIDETDVEIDETDVEIDETR
jgi:hypothetical protein